MSDCVIMATTILYKLYLQNLSGLTKPWLGFNAANIKVMLVSAAYVPSQSHQYKSDITNEVAGNGYNAGGELLTGKSVVTSQNLIYLKAANVSWPVMGFTVPRYAIVYDATNALDADKLLLGYLDLGHIKGKSLRIRWSSGIVLKITLENAVGFP